MKNKLVLALVALLIVVAFIGWNVWHAVYEPVTTPPSLVALGQQQLHGQLEQSKAREAEIEKQDWDSVTLLRGLIDAHQHRIDQLKGNSQAGEILAHDRDAIARLQKRITDLQAQEAQQAAQRGTESDETGAEPAAGSATEPGNEKPASKPLPKGPPTQPSSKGAESEATPHATKPVQKTQPTPASPKPSEPQSR